MPRTNFNYADWKTEIFALRSTFYYIMKGHEPYPDLNPDHDEERIVKRFTFDQFPEIECSFMNCVIHKCWAGKYDSMNAVLQDLEFVHECSMAENVRLCCKTEDEPEDR